MGIIIISADPEGSLRINFTFKSFKSYLKHIKQINCLYAH